ncbi:hypothetical protein KJZ61_02200 [Candidatus Dependentiae bacterium]|nr:hypothetical protein [Candidatus Dependentiae bacterium]
MKMIRSGVIIAMVLAFFMPSMNARRVNTHNEWPQWTEQHQLNGLDVTMRGLSKAETKKLFNARGKRLLKGKKSIRPIEIIIKNETDKEITAGTRDILVAINFSTPLRDVSRIINAPRRSFPRALAFGLLGAVGAGVCIGYAAYIVGSLYFFALGVDVLGSMMMGGFTAVYVCLPVVPTAGYLVGSRYSIVDDKHYVITDITQPITIEPRQKVQVYVFVDAKALC